MAEFVLELAAEIADFWFTFWADRRIDRWARRKQQESGPKKRQAGRQ